MSRYEASLKLLALILKGRKYNVVEKQEVEFYIEDKRQPDQQHILEVADSPGSFSLKIENPQKRQISILATDGTGGVFQKTAPPVRDESKFSYRWVTDFSTGSLKDKIAGACDCLMIDEKWRFIELKTEVLESGYNDLAYAQKVAKQNRDKAEMQIARTMAFFKEQSEDKQQKINAPFEAILVVGPNFPSTNAETLSRRLNFINRFEADLKEMQAFNKFDPKNSKGYLIE